MLLYNIIPKLHQNTNRNLLKLLSLNALCIQLPACLYSVFYEKSERYFDLSGFASFSLLSCVALVTQKPHARVPWAKFISTRKFTLYWFINSWIFRQSTQSIARLNRNNNRDSRFDSIRNNSAKFIGAFCMQTLWISATITPSLLYLANVAVKAANDLNYFSIGAYIMVIGYAIETMADLQKDKFKSDPENKSKFIDFGLWKYVEYPNYAGEIIFWSGTSLLCYPALKNYYAPKSKWPLLLSLLSPLYTAIQLTFLSGVNLQRKIALQRWQNDEDYWQYRKRVGLYYPNLFYWLKKWQKNDDDNSNNDGDDSSGIDDDDDDDEDDL